MISWDAAVQIDGNTTEEKQAEINSLRTFFKGFEDMLPVERECLERGKEDGHPRLKPCDIGPAARDQGRHVGNGAIAKRVKS